MLSYKNEVFDSQALRTWQTWLDAVDTFCSNGKVVSFAKATTAAASRIDSETCELLNMQITEDKNLALIARRSQAETAEVLEKAFFKERFIGEAPVSRLDSLYIGMLNSALRAGVIDENEHCNRYNAISKTIFRRGAALKATGPTG